MASFVLGGLLKGAGRGLVMDGKAKRAAALKELERQDRFALEEMRETGATERTRITAEGTERRHKESIEAADRRADRTIKAADKRADRQGGLLGKTIQAEDGTFYGVTKDGDVKQLGVKGARPGLTKGGKPPADVAAAEWLAKNRAASEGRKVTSEDFVNAYGEVKRSRDNPGQFANTVARVLNSMTTGTAALRDRRKIDEKAAEATAIVRKLYETAPRIETAPGPGKQPTDIETPPGAGTRDDPYKATTQDHVEWFKKNAPEGAVIGIEGKLYTK